MPSNLPASDIYPTTARPPGNAAAVPAATEYLTAARANAPFASGAPQVEGSNRKKPRPSKTKPGKHLSKSLSTPLLRGPVMSDAESADKKRNKLGYQRISIACAHCRRRKIRCLLAEDDTEQRCQNCIRLKKECVFYPVDQQAALDARSEASSKAGGAPSGPSSTVSSSPTQLATRSLNSTGQHYGGNFQHPPSDSPGGYQGIPIAPGGGIPSQGGYTPHEYGYGSHRESPNPWNPHEFGAQHHAVPVGEPGTMRPPYTRYGNVAGDTAPFPGSIDQHPHSARQAETFSYPPEHLQQPWQQQAPQPVRSLSYPDHPGHEAYNPVFPLNQQHPGSYTGQPHVQVQQPDPRLVPMAPGHSPIGMQHPQYMGAHDQRGTNMTLVHGYPPQQHMHPNWFPDPSSFGHHGEEEGRDHDYGGYSGRPG